MNFFTINSDIWPSEAKGTRSESSRERNGQGTKGPESELARVLLADSLWAANGPGSEKARYLSDNGNESSRGLWVKCGTAACGMRKVKCGMECAARRWLAVTSHHVTSSIPHFTTRCASIAWRWTAYWACGKSPFAQCMKLLDAGFWILLMNVENNYYLFITLLFISTAFVYHL